VLHGARGLQLIEESQARAFFGIERAVVLLVAQAPAANVCEGEEACGQYQERDGAKPQRKREERQEQYGQAPGNVAREHRKGECHEKAGDGRRGGEAFDPVDSFFGSLGVIEDVEKNPRAMSG
jgi:hypothetical protein